MILSAGHSKTFFSHLLTHDLVCRALEDFLQPLVDDALIQIAAAQMAHGDVSRPAVNSDGVPDYLTVAHGPARATVLQVRVFGFDVDGNALGTGQIGEFMRWHPLALLAQHH